MARQQVTVALSGDGGDELFAGYDRYQVAMSHRHFDHVPDWMGRLYRRRLHHHLPPGTYGKNRAWNASLSARERYLDDISIFPALHREKNFFTADFLRVFRRAAGPLGQFRRYYDDAPASDALSKLLYLDTKTYLAGDILTKVDRMSMATSLEVRVPMLDHEFVEWVAARPIVEVTKRNSEISAEEAGRTAGDSSYLAASAQTGVRASVGTVDEKRTQRAVALCTAGAAELAARLFQARRGTYAAVRTLAWAP